MAAREKISLAETLLRCSLWLVAKAVARWRDCLHPAVIDFRLGPALELLADFRVVLDELAEFAVVDVAAVRKRSVLAGSAAADRARILRALRLGPVGIFATLSEVSEKATVLAGRRRRVGLPLGDDPGVPRGDGLLEVGLRLLR